MNFLSKLFGQSNFKLNVYGENISHLQKLADYAHRFGIQSSREIADLDINDDAWMAGEHVIVVSDGVSGVRHSHNKDGFLLPQELVSKLLYKLSNGVSSLSDMISIIENVSHHLEETGATTLSAVTLYRNTLNVCAVGDSGFLLLRYDSSVKGGEYKIIAQSEPQMQSLNCPHQFSTMMREHQSRKVGEEEAHYMFARECSFVVENSSQHSLTVQENDIVMVFSDGFLDNFNTLSQLTTILKMERFKQMQETPSSPFLSTELSRKKAVHALIRSVVKNGYTRPWIEAEMAPLIIPGIDDDPVLKGNSQYLENLKMDWRTLWSREAVKSVVQSKNGNGRDAANSFWGGKPDDVTVVLGVVVNQSQVSEVTSNGGRIVAGNNEFATQNGFQSYNNINGMNNSNKTFMNVRGNCRADVVQRTIEALVRTNGAANTRTMTVTPSSTSATTVYPPNSNSFTCHIPLPHHTASIAASQLSSSTSSSTSTSNSNPNGNHQYGGGVILKYTPAPVHFRVASSSLSSSLAGCAKDSQSHYLHYSSLNNGTPTNVVNFSALTAPVLLTAPPSSNSTTTVASSTNMHMSSTMVLSKNGHNTARPPPLPPMMGPSVTASSEFSAQLYPYSFSPSMHAHHHAVASNAAISSSPSNGLRPGLIIASVAPAAHQSMTSNSHSTHFNSINSDSNFDGNILKVSSTSNGVRGMTPPVLHSPRDFDATKFQLSSAANPLISFQQHHVSSQFQQPQHNNNNILLQHASSPPPIQLNHNSVLTSPRLQPYTPPGSSSSLSQTFSTPVAPHPFSSKILLHPLSPSSPLRMNNNNNNNYRTNIPHTIKEANPSRLHYLASPLHHSTASIHNSHPSTTTTTNRHVRDLACNDPLPDDLAEVLFMNASRANRSPIPASNVNETTPIPSIIPITSSSSPIDSVTLTPSFIPPSPSFYNINNNNNNNNTYYHNNRNLNHRIFNATDQHTPSPLPSAPSPPPVFNSSSSSAASTVTPNVDVILQNVSLKQPPSLHHNTNNNNNNSSVEVKSNSSTPPPTTIVKHNAPYVGAPARFGSSTNIRSISSSAAPAASNNSNYAMSSSTLQGRSAVRNNTTTGAHTSDASGFAVNFKNKVNKSEHHHQQQQVSSLMSAGVGINHNRHKNSSATTTATSMSVNTISYVNTQYTSNDNDHLSGNDTSNNNINGSNSRSNSVLNGQMYSSSFHNQCNDIPVVDASLSSSSSSFNNKSDIHSHSSHPIQQPEKEKQNSVRPTSQSTAPLLRPNSVGASPVSPSSRIVITNVPQPSVGRAPSVATHAAANIPVSAPRPLSRQQQQQNSGEALKLSNVMSPRPLSLRPGSQANVSNVRNRGDTAMPSPGVGGKGTTGSTSLGGRLNSGTSSGNSQQHRRK